jgi:hypothetical protein
MPTITTELVGLACPAEREAEIERLQLQQLDPPRRRQAKRGEGERQHHADPDDPESVRETAENGHAMPPAAAAPRY